MYLLFCFCVKIVEEVFMLKKRQSKRIWTKEQKLAIIKRYYEEHISADSLAKEYDADKGMISRELYRHFVRPTKSLYRFCEAA